MQIALENRINNLKMEIERTKFTDLTQAGLEPAISSFPDYRHIPNENFQLDFQVDYLAEFQSANNFQTTLMNYFSHLMMWPVLQQHIW